MNFTLCICTRGNSNFCKNIINCILNQNFKDFKVIIQDNTPYNNGDNTLYSDLEKIIKKDNRFLFVHEECGGLSESRNICINLCETDYIHFLDDDVWIHEDFCERLNYFLVNNPDVSCVGGKVLPDWSLVKRPDWITNNCLMLLSMINYGEEEKKFGANNGVPVLVGANICFKKNKLVEYGKFSTNLGRKADTNSLIGNEEYDLLLRMETKEKIMYSPDIAVMHFVKPDRANIEWFIKRVSWQSVSDIMSGNSWIDNQPNRSAMIKRSSLSIANGVLNNIDDLLYNVQYLTYQLLSGKIK